MPDSPERIWAKVHGARTDVMSGQRGLLGAWHECQREGHTAYVREDLVTALEAENQRLREALHKIEAAPAWGYPDKWETTPAEVRQLARAALRSTEASHE